MSEPIRSCPAWAYHAMGTAPSQAMHARWVDEIRQRRVQLPDSDVWAGKHAYSARAQPVYEATVTATHVFGDRVQGVPFESPRELTRTLHVSVCVEAVGSGASQYSGPVLYAHVETTVQSPPVVDALVGAQTHGRVPSPDDGIIPNEYDDESEYPPQSPIFHVVPVPDDGASGARPPSPPLAPRGRQRGLLQRLWARKKRGLDVTDALVTGDPESGERRRPDDDDAHEAFASDPALDLRQEVELEVYSDAAPPAGAGVSVTNGVHTSPPSSAVADEHAEPDEDAWCVEWPDSDSEQASLYDTLWANASSGTRRITHRRRARLRVVTDRGANAVSAVELDPLSECVDAFVALVLRDIVLNADIQDAVLTSTRLTARFAYANPHVPTACVIGGVLSGSAMAPDYFALASRANAMLRARNSDLGASCLDASVNDDITHTLLASMLRERAYARTGECDGYLDGMVHLDATLGGAGPHDADVARVALVGTRVQGLLALACECTREWCRRALVERALAGNPTESVARALASSGPVAAQPWHPTRCGVWDAAETHGVAPLRDVAHTLWRDSATTLKSITAIASAGGATRLNADVADSGDRPTPERVVLWWRWRAREESGGEQRVGGVSEQPSHALLTTALTLAEQRVSRAREARRVERDAQAATAAEAAHAASHRAQPASEPTLLLDGVDEGGVVPATRAHSFGVLVDTQ